MILFRRKNKTQIPEEIKNYYEDIERMKTRNKLKLDRWHYLQYLKFREIVKTKTTQELGVMLSEGYKGAFWHVLYNEYKQRQK